MHIEGCRQQACQGVPWHLTGQSRLPRPESLTFEDNDLRLCAGGFVIYHVLKYRRDFPG